MANRFLLLAIVAGLLCVGTFYRWYVKTEPVVASPSFSKTSEIRVSPPDSLPIGMRRLLTAYPGWFIGASPNALIWKDSTLMPFDDGIANKSFDGLLDSADLEDQVMAMPYPMGRDTFTPKRNDDPGRSRYEPFFLKMYGASKREVASNLTTIVWLPNSLKTPLKVTRLNGVDKKLEAISAELEKLPALRKYLENPGGTFNWRVISGTNRLSTHSFGITIDINTQFSNYWQWDYKNWQTEPKLDIAYRNRIPLEIVRIFEKHGFIWGGRWYHYDTMHFEYRPELLANSENSN